MTNSSTFALRASQLADIIISNTDYLHLHIHHLQFAAILLGAKIDELDHIDLDWVLKRSASSSDFFIKSMQKKYLKSINEFVNSNALEFEGFNLLHAAFCYNKNSSGYYESTHVTDTPVLIESSYLKQYCILLGIPYKKDDTAKDIINNFYFKVGYRTPFQIKLFAILYQHVNQTVVMDYKNEVTKLLNSTDLTSKSDQAAAEYLTYLITWDKCTHQKEGFEKIITLIGLFFNYWMPSLKFNFSKPPIAQAKIVENISSERFHNASLTADRMAKVYEDEKDYLYCQDYEHNDKSVLSTQLILLENQYDQIQTVQNPDDLLIAEKQKIESNLWKKRAELYIFEKLILYGDYKIKIIDEIIKDAENHFKLVAAKNEAACNYQEVNLAGYGNISKIKPTVNSSPSVTEGLTPSNQVPELNANKI